MSLIQYFADIYGCARKVKAVTSVVH